MNLRSFSKSGGWSAYLAVSALLPLAGFGQQAAAPAESSIKLEKFVVTGSNIPSTLTAGEASALPVVTIDRKVIDSSGYQTAAELLQKLTTSNGGSVPISNNATGFTPAAASISLHGLGPEATLVLINSHRVADYPIGNGGQTAFVDLNSIPLSAVEKIEVLTSGASAIYGADAVAGVVNIIFRKNYDGAEVNFRYGNTTNKDSHELVFSFVQGATSETSSITAGGDYYSRQAIFNKDRSYSTVPPYVSTNSSPINGEISLEAANVALGLPPGSLPPGVDQVNSDPNDDTSPLVNPTTIFFTPGIFPGRASGNAVSPDGNILPGSTNNGLNPPNQYIYSNGRQSVWNFNQTSGASPVFQHYGAFANFDKKLFGSENIKTYVEVSYQHNYSESELAPLATGTFTTPGSVEYVIPARTATPVPTPDGRPRAAAPGAYNPFNPFNQDITGGTKFRLYEFGNRILKTDNDAFLATAGLKLNNILENWNADMGARYSTIGVHQNFKLVSTSRFNQIVNANDPIFNPGSSTYIGTTTPYNPFGYAGAPIASNALTVKYATVYVKDEYTSYLRNPFFTLSTGSAFHLPGGDVGLALGVDYRIETLDQNPDAISLLGDAGSGAANLVNKSRSVLAFFAEARVPVISPAQHIPFVYDLSMQLAARDERFLTSGQSKLVPAVALRYQPLDNTLTLRGSLGKGIRQPSLFELYGGTVNGLQSLVDPRNGNELPETPTQTGSNTGLKSEQTKSYTAGVVWSPKVFHLDGFTMNVDFWRVEREGTVVSNAQNTLDRRFGASPGGLQPGENVILSAGGTILSVTAPYINSGKTLAQGLDIGMSYVWKTASFGRFDFSLGGTDMFTYRQAFIVGQELESQLAKDASGGQGLDGYLRWKAKAGIDWAYKDLAATLSANYTSGFDDLDGDGNPFVVDSLTTFDLQVGYTFHNVLTKYLDNTKVSIGALNLLDKDPPFSSGYGSNASGYPGFLYDSTGRFLYVQLSKKF